MTYHIIRHHFENGCQVVTETDNVSHLRADTAVREVCQEMVRVRDASGIQLDGQLREMPEYSSWFANLWDPETGDTILEWIVVPTKH